MTVQDDDLIDLLRSLSIIEGAVRGGKDREVQQTVMDELDWCVEMLLKLLKE